MLEFAGLLSAGVAIIVALGGWLMNVLGDAKKAEGKREAQLEEIARNAEADRRATEVLMENRDPDDATRRLSDGSF